MIDVSKSIKDVVNRMSKAYKSAQTGINAMIKTPSADELRIQNPYSYEDNNIDNNIQKKMFGMRMPGWGGLYNEFYKPPITKPKRIPIPPPESEIINQIQPQMQQQQAKINSVPIEPQQTPQPTQIPQPTNAPGVPVYISAKKYDVDNGGDGNIAQPPKEVYDLASKYFQGDDVEKAIIASLFESNYRADRTNRDPETGKVPKGGEDRGLMQINENSFKDYMRRMPKLLAQYGITSYDDMWDAEKNMAMASIIHKYQGFGAWYGPANNGYNIYNSPEIYQRNRGAIEAWKAENNSPTA